MTLLMLAQEAVNETQATRLSSLYQTILDGGICMVPIGLCSIVALGFIVERWVSLRGSRLIPGRFKKELESALESGPERALELCQSRRAPVARVFAAGLRRWSQSPVDIEKAVEDAGAHEISTLSAPLKPLVVVAAVAPLLGLLGTVFGMIKAFNVVAQQHGAGKPELLAEGIAEALITTAAGLIVAIPVQVMWFYFKGRIDRFSRRVEEMYHQVLGRVLDLRRAA